MEKNCRNDSVYSTANFFGMHIFFWIEQVHARHWVPMSANKRVSHPIFLAPPFFPHIFFG